MYFDSFNKLYKNPFGAVYCGEEMEFNIEIPNLNVSVFLVFQSDENVLTFSMQYISIKEGNNFYNCKFKAPLKENQYWYYFEIHENEKTYYYGNNEECLGGVGKQYTNCPNGYQLTIYKQGIKTPDWLKNGIMYQIFVDRFYNGNEDKHVKNIDESVFFKRDWGEEPGYEKDENGNVIKYDFYGGNLKGIIKKLPYLKSLGVSIIYLNPIFESWSNHKYDTADYKKIDSMFGNKNTFKLLCSEAKKQGINIILDGVFNHTGSDSIYFNKNGRYKGKGAYQSQKSKYYSWYSFEEYPNKYKSWWGVENMPTINKNSDDFEDFIMTGKDSVIHYWMKAGAKGWRLDVVDELPDEFVKELKKELKSQDEDAVLIGEVWEDASNKISYGKRRKYFQGEELDSVMNYPWRKIIVSYILGQTSGRNTLRKLLNLYENYPKEYFYSNMNLIGSHDVPRILSVLKENNDGNSIKMLRMISLLQFTFPGVPVIYYGDEAGVEGLKDPDNRKTYPWGNENKEIVFWYMKITELRNKNAALRVGEWIPIYGDEHVLCYLRWIKDNIQHSVFIVIFNNDKDREHTVSIAIPKECTLSKCFFEMLSSNNVELISGRLVVTVPSLGVNIFKNNLK